MIEKLLIHTCCADCLLNLLDALEQEEIINKDTKLTLLYYNPNIHPRTEYLERLNALKKIIGEGMIKQMVTLIIPEYRPKEYFDKISKEKKRCIGCWRNRIEYLFKYASEHNFNFVSSTLLSSHYQDTETIKDLAQELETKDIKTVYPQKAHEHIKTGGFYKQNFCGCCFSLSERMLEKYKG